MRALKQNPRRGHPAASKHRATSTKNKGLGFSSYHPGDTEAENETGEEGFNKKSWSKGTNLELGCRQGGAECWFHQIPWILTPTVSRVQQSDVGDPGQRGAGHLLGIYLSWRNPAAGHTEPLWSEGNWTPERGQIRISPGMQQCSPHGFSKKPQKTFLSFYSFWWQRSDPGDKQQRRSWGSELQPPETEEYTGMCVMWSFCQRLTMDIEFPPPPLPNVRFSKRVWICGSAILEVLT